MNNRKGFGEVASTLIMFIAVVGVTLGVVLTFQNFVVKSQDSLSSQQELTSNKLKSALTISNTYYNSSSQQLFVYVKNIGEKELETQLFDVFVNGRFQEDFKVTNPTDFTNNLEFIQIQDTGALVINKSINQGTHDVEVVTQFGVSAKKSFNN